MLRPGNATAANAGDQLAVINEAIAALPAGWRAGHAPDIGPSGVMKRSSALTTTSTTTTQKHTTSCTAAPKEASYSSRRDFSNWPWCRPSALTAADAEAIDPGTIFRGACDTSPYVHLHPNSQSLASSAGALNVDQLPLGELADACHKG